jgi:hypothetical protein
MLSSLSCCDLEKANGGAGIVATTGFLLRQHRAIASGEGLLGDTVEDIGTYI